MRLDYLSVQRYHGHNRLRNHQARDFLSFRGDKLDMTVKEIIPLEKIGFDHKFRGIIGTAFGRNLKEIIRDILFT